MKLCWRCTLIFDAEPVEIGRSEIDPNLCTLCAENIQRRVQRNPTMNHHQSISTGTGPRRLCPQCKQSISTTRRKFDQHPVPGSDSIFCSGSGTPVERPRIDPAQMQLDLLD